MQDEFSRVSSEENLKTNGPTIFLPLSSKIGGLVNKNKPSIEQYLTREQANFVYKKTESGEMINKVILQQELEHERQLDKIDDTNGDTNPYKELIVKKCKENRTIANTDGTVVNFEQHTKLYTLR